MSDAPIVPQNYTFGVDVVDIGDLRVARGMTRRPVSVCRHKSLVYDRDERRIWCRDCESTVDPFDAFEGLVEVYDSGLKQLKRQREELAKAEQLQIRSRAAKAFDEVWRSRTAAPLCPHCREAILPEDVARGLEAVSKSLVQAARKRRAERDKEKR